MVRPGYLQRSRSVLDLIANNSFSRSEISIATAGLSSIPVEAIVEFLEECGYLQLTESGTVGATVSGERARSHSSVPEFCRQALTDYLDQQLPEWLGPVRQGRDAFVNFAGPELRQCFEEAGLMEFSAASIAWWDLQFLRGKDFSDTEKLRIGRIGEECSMNYERDRVGRFPKWVSSQRPRSPFDLLSFLDSSSQIALVIEVKASKRSFAEAEFFITESEWEVLKSAPHAVMHLWSSVDQSPYFCHVEVEALARHIPTNNEDGRWQATAIPFSAFSEHE